MRIDSIDLEVNQHSIENNFTLRAPNLFVTAMCDAYACVADSYSCTFHYENNGNQQAENVVLNAPIPPHVTVTNITQPNCALS